MAVPTFVDEVTLQISAGRGGNGVASVHREKFKPLGGPDGGNGGPGGSVILRVDPDVTTLIDYHHIPKRRAEHGGHGAGAHKNGAQGVDLVLSVPDGTLVSTKDGEVLADMVGAGTELVIATGGRGGLGNAALASAKRKAPGFALLGEPGGELDVVLELKVVADVGLVSAETEIEDLPGSVRRGRVYAGFSGWGPGQLEAEIEEDAWIVEAPVPAELFAEDSEALWSAVLERKGGRFALLARMPLDPSLN